MNNNTAMHLRDDSDILLRVENLIVEYTTKTGTVRAVSDISLDIASGETVAVVGESGCGKSTLAKGVMQLIPSVSGKVLLNGTDLASLKG